MSMKRVVASLLVGVAALCPATIAAQLAPKRCFTQKEMTAEQVVRYGLTLREGAAVCSKTPHDFKLYPLWLDIDQKLGPQFAINKGIREVAFRREFGPSALNRLEMWDGRIVFYYRYVPVTADLCKEMRDNLEAVQKGGWAQVTKRSALNRDNVQMTFKRCD